MLIFAVAWGWHLAVTESCVLVGQPFRGLVPHGFDCDFLTPESFSRVFTFSQRPFEVFVLLICNVIALRSKNVLWIMAIFKMC